MQSIQFLDPPAIRSRGSPSRSWIYAVISIVSLPGNTPFNTDVTVEASLLSGDEETPCLEGSYPWQAGSTSLRIEFEITHVNVVWPAKIKVGAKDQDIIRLTDVVDHGIRDAVPKAHVNTAWSEGLEPRRKPRAEAIMERKFVLSSDRLITIWERFDQVPAAQLRPVGVAMLAYIDSVVANQLDAVPELGEKLALAASKRLYAIDFCNNCGIVGIGLAQLIPDCRVTILDAPGDDAMVEMNIREMFPAIMSSVEYEQINSISTKSIVHGTKHIDLIFLADDAYDEESVKAISETLAHFLETSPRVVILLAQEIVHSEPSAFEDVLWQGNASHCGRVSVPSFYDEDTPTDERPFRFSIDVYQGKEPPSRTRRLASVRE